jgi:hypothetical protein
LSQSRWKRVQELFGGFFPLAPRRAGIADGIEKHLSVPEDPLQYGVLGLVARWTLNGLEFDHNRVDACPRLGSTERWLLVAPTNEMDHVVHIHDVDSLMISRNFQPPPAYEAGLKETYHLNPTKVAGAGRGDVVEVVLKFTDHLGRYMIHCHMLEHEDGAMMARFEVVPEEGPLPPECPTDAP